MIHFILNWRAKIANGSLEPEKAGANTLDSTQYQWMFNSCRVPATPIDYATKISETDPRGQHIVLIRNDHFFKLPIADEAGTLYSTATFQKALHHIWSLPLQPGSTPPIGVLSGLGRDEWAHHYETLLQTDAGNKQAIEAIETSAFILVLEDEPPTDKADFARTLWHGTGHNRWWDKPLQWVLYRTGICGFIGEHSTMDGSPVCRYSSFQYMMSMLISDPEKDRSTQF